MKQYKIKTVTKKGENYASMIIVNRDTGERCAEYRLTPGREQSEIAAMRRVIDRHLSGPGATLGNYQW